MKTIPGAGMASGGENQTNPKKILRSFGVALSGVARPWRYLVRFFRLLTLFAFGIFLVFFVPFVIGNFVLSTPRDRAYRNFHPAMELCKAGLETGWTILAEVDLQKAKTASAATRDDWVDPSNDESDAVDKDAIWEKRLRCSLQRHVIPIVAATTGAVKKPINYYLSFLEYKESGEPYSLVLDGAKGDELPSADFLEKLVPEKNAKPPINQLDVLMQHLSTGSNYVVVFAHGWRHDASIGDQNVADLRLYAAHAARFLAERCEREKRYCDTRVTAIYVGWRGARVNESGMKRYLGSLGVYLGGFAAFATLFDRKPVSEQVAPGAISALRTIESLLSERDIEGKLKPNPPLNKMIVFGHSLGGNLLATGLKDDLIKLVRRHNPGEHLPPVLGDLVVLINPAAEASKWIAVQREVWNRIAFHTDENTPIGTDGNGDSVLKGHLFFPTDQRPVIISVTAALTFPAGGLRDADCEWLNLKIADNFERAREKINADVSKSRGMFAQGIEYDFATHDLFPAFKFDFRPLAQWFDRRSAEIQGQPPPGQSWLQHTPTWYQRVLSIPTRLAASFFRTFPFQNTDKESSRTIGNLDPPRPAFGVLVQALTSAAPFGTTHELSGSLGRGDERHHSYSAIPIAPISCSPANNWLLRARKHPDKPHGTFWDSNYLAAKTPGAVEEGRPAAQFMHGFNLGGIAAITRANDPFWNMRAFDNELSKHDGYRLSSFICAINQLVMDNITTSTPAMPSKARDPTQPPTTAPN